MKINKHELLKTIGYLGAALLAAAAIRYQIEGALRTFTQVLLIAGGVMVLAAVALNFAAVRAWLARRSTRMGANTLIQVSSVLAILIVANVLGYRYHKRFDLTEEQLYSLSDQTRQVLAKLDRDVRILEFDKSSSPRLAELVTEYRAHSRRITYELIDPQERPDLARQHRIQREREVVLAAGERSERLPEFSEQELTNTILKLTRDATKTVCFTEGHGEKQLASSEARGYAAVEQALRDENYEVQTINLTAEESVPAGCTVVVVAGPQRPFLAQETAMLQSYLDGGGKALLLLEPGTDPQLGALLGAWGVEVGDDLVVENNLLSQLSGTGPVVPVVREYGRHAISERPNLAMTIYPTARTVRRAAEPPAGVDLVELLRTSEASFAETDFASRRVGFDEGRDTAGPLAIGVAAQKDIAATEGEGAAEEKEQARLVVLGDSDFAVNAYFAEVGNRDFFLNTVNWLAEEEDRISVRPKNPTNRRVTLTEAEQRLLFWFTLVLLPGAVILAGAWIWWKRR